MLIRPIGQPIVLQYTTIILSLNLSDLFVRHWEGGGRGGTEREEKGKEGGGGAIIIVPVKFLCDLFEYLSSRPKSMAPYLSK